MQQMQDSLLVCLAFHHCSVVGKSYCVISSLPCFFTFNGPSLLEMNYCRKNFQVYIKIEMFTELVHWANTIPCEQKKVTFPISLKIQVARIIKKNQFSFPFIAGIGERLPVVIKKIFEFHNLSSSQGYMHVNGSNIRVILK